MHNTQSQFGDFPHYSSYSATVSTEPEPGKSFHMMLSQDPIRVRKADVHYLDGRYFL